jgi:predicted CXXCH cytochrome family protein
MTIPNALRLFFLLLLLVPALSMAEGAGGMNSSKECSMCHLRWMDDYLEKEGRDYLLDYPDDKVVSDELMCYSCHDGSIADSRLRVWETNKHKGGTKPSAAISVPEEYPLDAEGRIQCGTCHSAHGVDTRVDMASAIFLREPNINSSMCQKCHKDKNRGPKKGSHPVNVEFKDFPQEIVAAGGVIGEGSKLVCESCHTPHGSTNDDFLIIPNSEASLTQSMLCEACHGVSPDLNSEPALRRHSHPVDVALPKEAKLPAKWDNGEEPRLGRGKQVNCRTCHSPHNGTQDNHLLVHENRGDSLCITCHTSKELIYRTRHDIAELHPDEKNSAGAKASEKGTCSACHFMHKGAGPKMWSRELTDGSMQGLCDSCHNENGMAKDALTGDITHPVDTPLPVGMPSGTLPLFSKNGKKGDGGEVTCASCHDVHRWSPESDSRGDEAIPGDGRDSFLRKSVTSGGLCQACHERQAAIKETKHDLHLAAPGQRNLNKQTPEESGVCGACHMPHNAYRKKLWARKTGDGMDLIERQCNVCHKKGGMAEDRTTGAESHPLKDTPNMEASAKELLPLYIDGGEKSEEGWVTCATCHDVHRWGAKLKKGPGSMKVEGDRMTSFLRVPYDDSASLCAACHKKNSYIVGSDHDMRVTAPDERNMNQQTAGEAGVCSACHEVHNAWGNGLWSRSVGVGENRNEARCNGCHERRKAASRKALHGPSHPMNKRVFDAKATLQNEITRFYRADSEAKLKTELPLFTPEGYRSIEGDISCPTCHDPHRWDPRVEGPGPGDKVEGDGGNSFLRKSNLPNSDLCTTCHTQKAFIMDTDHDLALTGPEDQNLLKQTVADSGVCSACHVPHGARRDGYRLWAREPGEGSDLMQERMCLGCHMPGKVAGDKVVTEFNHPSGVLVTQAHRRGNAEYAPVFDLEGNKADSGIITCATCHDPHTWQPGKKRLGPGALVEGSNKNSFLRFKSAKNVCRNCHGVDSLQKFKYFHAKSSRKQGGAKAGRSRLQLPQR